MILNEIPDNLNDEKTLGFIILRHINSDSTNRYWKYSYDSIRRYYPENKIVIIDDNSNPDFLTNKELYNAEIIQSEFPGRGELLPYHYYFHGKFFDTAVIIHDSVFINSYIDFTVENYKFIWSFEHMCCQEEDQQKMINLFQDEELLEFYHDKSLWKGCFGGMTVITHDFLTRVNSKYDLDVLLNVITSRYNRMSFERVFACLLQKEEPKQVLIDDIHNYIRTNNFNWGLSFDEKERLSNLPIIKIWSGR